MTAFAALALLLAAGRASAADSRPLTWQDCVGLALRGNPDLAAARFAGEAGRANYRGSFNRVLPTLSLTNTRSETESATPNTHRWSAGATARLDLFDMAGYAGIRSSKAAWSRAEAQARQTSTELRFNLRRAFLQLLFAQENSDVSRFIRRIRADGAQAVNLRYESGRESKGNMLRARAQLLQAEADVAQSERDLRAARRALERHLGFDEFRHVSATGTLAAPAAPQFPERAEDMIELRPDIAVRQSDIRSAEAGLSSAKSALWPKVSASFSRDVTGRTEFPNSRWGWSAVGTLSLPLFGGGPSATYYDVAGSRSGLARAREELRAARSAAVADVEGAWSDFARASAQAGVQAVLLEAARQRSEEADIRYAGGLLSYDNWEIIATDRVSQERQELQSRLNAMSNEAAWDRARGRGLED